MGVLDRFKRAPAGKIEKFADFVAAEERRQFRSVFDRTKFRQPRIVSFILAELCYQMEVRPELEGRKLRPEYRDMIAHQRKDPVFEEFLRFMLNYHTGTPRRDKALFNITASYVQKCWSVSEKYLRDAELMGQLSIYLKESRDLISKYLLQDLEAEIFEADNSERR